MPGERPIRKISKKRGVKVPQELEDRMARFKGINWSQVARTAFEARVREEERQEGLEEEGPHP